MTRRHIMRLKQARLIIGALAALAPINTAAARPSDHDRVHHARRRPHQAYQRIAPVFAPGYGSGYDPTPTCRYADGTPYDPDIIGGPNHVGDGGPAGNLGGSNPCGY